MLGEVWASGRISASRNPYLSRCAAGCRFDSKLNAITAVLGQIKVEAKRPGTARAAGIDELTPRIRVRESGGRGKGPQL